MRILSIEPTPSPHSMKIVLNEKVSQGATYSESNSQEAPDYIQKILRIEGVKSIFQVADFLAVERNPKVDWPHILPQVREIFGEDSAEKKSVSSRKAVEAFGEVKVFVQTFRGIPIQLKMIFLEEERRVALPPRFAEAIMKAQASSTNMVMERRWGEWGVRYGEWERVKEEVIEEVSASYDEARLAKLIQEAFEQGPGEREYEKRTSYPVTLSIMQDSDWRKRYAALEQMNPTEEDIPILAFALSDEKPMVRRLAIAYLGGLEKGDVLPFLIQGLKDASVTVRRTAGDALSDKGDTQAIPAMIEALADKSRLVRWRAAMFLYETGDQRALPALKKAQEDPEFEVAMQARMALERIEQGEEASGSVWQQMTRRHQ